MSENMIQPLGTLDKWLQVTRHRRVRSDPIAIDFGPRTKIFDLSAPGLHTPRHSDYVDVQRRISSLEQLWPHSDNQSPTELAEAGFFFSDETLDDTSHSYCERRQRYPWVINVTSLPDLNTCKTKSDSDGNKRHQAPGLHTPRHSDYVDVQRRISSLEQLWPHSDNQSPTELAEAGFFFSGETGDSTTCFYCGGRLKNWMQGDNPYVEHARWFPRCDFIRQVKGDNFVDLVQEMDENEEEIPCEMLSAH